MKYSLSLFGGLHGTTGSVMGEMWGEGMVLLDELASFDSSMVSYL